jgi:hypothetical protein
VPKSHSQFLTSIVCLPHVGNACLEEVSYVVFAPSAPSRNVRRQEGNLDAFFLWVLLVACVGVLLPLSCVAWVTLNAAEGKTPWGMCVSVTVGETETTESGDVKCCLTEGVARAPMKMRGLWRLAGARGPLTKRVVQE